MKQIKNFTDISQRLSSLNEKKIVVVACPNDEHTQTVIERALENSIADFVLVNNTSPHNWSDYIKEQYEKHVTSFDASTTEMAASLAVDIVRQGGGDVLMKGKINTDILLHAILDKKHGLTQANSILSHIAIADIPSYNKFLIFSDAAVIPYPTLEQYRAIIKYCTKTCSQLDIIRPNIALINCTERSNGVFPIVKIYEQLKNEAQNGYFGDICIDGPMDVKTACDTESSKIKCISSSVAGNADVLVFPDIQSGNVFYKTITLFANATTAGILCGTTKPVIVSSRADSVDSKFYSLAVACTLSHK